jgi:adenine-specific DNA-methyltransferase
MHDLILPLESKEFLSEQLITYIGNKRKLLDFIEIVICEIKDQLDLEKLSLLDGFSGSGVVSRMLKAHSSTLHTNDLEPYAAQINRCYLANHHTVPMETINEAIAELNACKLRDDFGRGFIEELYAPKDDQDIQEGERVFYTNQNARIIDNMRRMLDAYSSDLKPFLLGPLLHKASVHANTSGVFKGFYKNSKTNRGQFGGNASNCLSRITKEIELPKPIFSVFDCDVAVHQRDINDLVKEVEVDVAYFDPPYNQHPYGSNYFMLNLITDYQPPGEISEVAGIPVDWNKSAYNKRQQAALAFENLIRDTQAKYVLMSYNDEGTLRVDELTTIFAKYGTVEVRRQQYSAFRASRNLHKRSKTVDELLFIVKK